MKKFIEVALVLDKAMFEKRPHSTRKDVIHDAIQVANIADLVKVLISGINIRVALFQKILFKIVILHYIQRLFPKTPKIINFPKKFPFKDC